MDYDFIPVRREEAIVGLLDRTMATLEVDEETIEPYRAVHELMDPLHESILMSSEASLLSFVASAAAHPCRRVVSGTRIDGIVTVADIQKLPVRPMLFLLVTHLETLMAEALRVVFPDGDGWLHHLKPPRRKGLEEKCIALRHRDMELDKLVVAEFCDKKEALIGSDVPLPFGKGKAAKQLEQIEALRNGLAHAGEYAGTREAAALCAETVRLTQSWIDYLTGWVSAHSSFAKDNEVCPP